MAHKKGASSSRNGRDSTAQRLGVKRFGGQVVNAGEILVRRYDRLRALDARQVFVPFVLIAGFVQLVAWWTNARRFAVGIRGPRWFVPSAEWSPPFGWWPWLLLALAGVGVLILTPLLDRLLSGRSSGVADEGLSVGQRTDAASRSA